MNYVFNEISQGNQLSPYRNCSLTRFEQGETT